MLILPEAHVWACACRHTHTPIPFMGCFFFSFITLHHNRPALTQTKMRQRCGSRLLLPDILQCICRLPFHSNDGQGHVTAFSLSPRAFLNIFCSSCCIRWQNGNRCRSLNDDVEAWRQTFYLLSLCRTKTTNHHLLQLWERTTGTKVLQPQRCAVAA